MHHSENEITWINTVRFVSIQTSLLERLPGAPDLFDVRENDGFLHQPQKR